MASMGDEQPRHCTCVYPICRWDARRRHCQDDGGNVPAAEGYASDVLRRRDWDEEQRSDEEGRCKRPDWENRLAEGERARRRTYADAMEHDAQCGVHKRNSVAAGSHFV